MQRSTFTSTLAAGAMLAALAACSGDSTSPKQVVPDATATADIAATEGADMAADVDVLNANEVVAGVGLSVVRPTDAAPASASATPLAAIACPFNGNTGRHVCGSATSGTLTISRSFAFLDGNGQPMQNYDSLLTAAINFQFTLDGSFSGPNFSAQTHKTRNATVSGLLGKETSRTWNGLGTKSDTASHTGDLNTRTYVGSASDSVKDVVVTLPRSSNPYPASGRFIRNYSATVTVTGATPGSRSITRRLEVNFNGTNIVPIVIGVGAGAKTCSLNLDTRTVSGCA